MIISQMPDLTHLSAFLAPVMCVILVIAIISFLRKE